MLYFLAKIRPLILMVLLGDIRNIKFSSKHSYSSVKLSNIFPALNSPYPSLSHETSSSLEGDRVEFTPKHPLERIIKIKTTAVNLNPST
ncbi:MAG: Uncharacterized protein XD54_0149 [Thermococcus sibiricus]|uniref:Uncharacterized protein n=2 Tax=Thermococcus sibiricus TaxID=172049 RepID=C6A2Z7_THESM|nr:hypothetical protein TSIB_0934 [Thermococcus sibiricus MM 739]KUK18589.1 MAG: Uncharacterized protein XD54_0149 [Thermococcus sibiricus]KUK29401.1 MAG: Uncharacterized protein XD61_0047 [Thermococcus sp. 40_45]